MSWREDVVAPAPWGSAPRRVRPAGTGGSGGPTGTVAALVLLVVLVLVLGVVRTYLVGPVSISSTSMEPTFFAGDVVLVDRRDVGSAELARGDLVTFRSPQTGEEVLKRVIGLPGDSVATIDAIVHVNDEPIEEPYVDFRDWEGVFNARVVVPPGHVYLLGDNRGDSVDSRDFGTVPEEALDGRVLVRLWPVVRVGGPTPQPPLP